MVPFVHIFDNHSILFWCTPSFFIILKTNFDLIWGELCECFIVQVIVAFRTGRLPHLRLISVNEYIVWMKVLIEDLNDTQKVKVFVSNRAHAVLIDGSIFGFDGIEAFCDI